MIPRYVVIEMATGKIVAEINKSAADPAKKEMEALGYKIPEYLLYLRVGGQID